MGKTLKKRNPSIAGEVKPNAAGIDIGAYEIYVAVPEGRDKENVRSFSTFTDDLKAMSRWLKACRIQSVAMESTGVYWIPVYQILEREGFEVYLVNARHIKNVPGRKTDVLDCQWIQYLHSVGLLRASFRPSADVVAIRTLLRHREGLVKMAATHIQHMQKSLTQMNLFLHNVINDITGKTGLKILDAIVQGERDPYALARYRDRRIKVDEETIARSLEGDYKQEHLFTLKQALELYRYYKKQIEACDGEMERYLIQYVQTEEPDNGEKKQTTIGSERKKPKGNEYHFEIEPYLNHLWGVDLTKIPGISELGAAVIYSEIGNDIHRFPTVKHFTSWLSLSPKNKISGNKVLSSKTMHSANRVAKALRLAAYGIGNSKSYLGEYYRKMRSRLGAPKAITATAHKLARIIYVLLKKKMGYDESLFIDEVKKSEERKRKRLRRQAAELGLMLVEVEGVVT
jgi:transposase